MSRQSTKKTYNNSNEPELSYSDLIALMDIYEREWEYRNDLFWKQIYKMYYLSLVIMVLPKITKMAQINLPEVPALLFPIIGLVIALFSLVMSKSYGVRTEASSETYRRIISMLPSQYRRVTLEELSDQRSTKKQKQKKRKYIFSWKQQYVISRTLFFTEILVAAIMFYDLLF